MTSADAATLARPRLVARGSFFGRPESPAYAVRRPAASAGVASGRATRSRAMRLNLFAGVVALLAMLLHVWTGLTVGTLGYELARARALGQRLDRQLNELGVENSSLMKPDLLAQEAGRRLGLGWPQSGQIVDLP